MGNDENGGVFDGEAPLIMIKMVRALLRTRPRLKLFLTTEGYVNEPHRTRHRDASLYCYEQIAV